MLKKSLKIRTYKAITLLLALYGCETWSVMFENRVLRRIFGLTRDEVRGGWRKLRNEELHDLYYSPSIIKIIKLRRMRLAGLVARMGMEAERV
jgi:hypothetical protein